MIVDAVDLFAGPGGWSEGLRLLGRADVGIDNEINACRTREAAGHAAILADVSTYPTAPFAGCVGVIASPPCPAFSTAGNQEGREHLPALISAIHRRDWSARPDPDPRIWLALEVGRWWETLQPEWVALEQVPAVLPLWHAFAAPLKREGYSVWAGILNAANYGVPQIRKRAILMASRTRPVHPPTHTHARDPAPSLFGQLARWVTMAEALGWTGRVGFPRLDDTGTSEDGYRERDRRDVTEPSQTLTEKARSWVHEPMIVSTGLDWEPDGSCQEFDAATEPARTVTATTGGQWWLNRQREGKRDGWEHDRPATTIAGDPRVFAPGSHAANDGRNPDNAIARSDEAIRITIRDALILQSFRPDYPVAGNKTRQFEQIGNAVPPLLARAILEVLV